jgi:hypothetical protein
MSSTNWSTPTGSFMTKASLTAWSMSASVTHRRWARFFCLAIVPRALCSGGTSSATPYEGNAVSETIERYYLERFIHAEIYRARPDLLAVAHSHSPSVIFSTCRWSTTWKRATTSTAGAKRRSPAEATARTLAAWCPRRCSAVRFSTRRCVTTPLIKRPRRLLHAHRPAEHDAAVGIAARAGAEATQAQGRCGDLEIRGIRALVMQACQVISAAC